MIKNILLLLTLFSIEIQASALRDDSDQAKFNKRTYGDENPSAAAAAASGSGPTSSPTPESSAPAYRRKVNNNQSHSIEAEDRSSAVSAATSNTIMESRVRTDRLAYFYENTYYDFTGWEEENIIIIRGLAEKIHENRQLISLNIALAQLSFLYKSDTEVKIINIPLPCFYMSRWPDKRELSDIGNQFNLSKQSICQDTPYKDYTRFHVGDGKGYSWEGYYPQLRTHLKSLIEVKFGTESTLNEERISKRITQINPQDGNFGLHYFHSEQAILIYLLQRTEDYLSKNLEDIRGTNKVLCQGILNIISYNDMCERCGDTFYRTSEQGKIVEKFKEYLEPKNVNFSEDFNLFIACSGLKAYPDDNKSFLRSTSSSSICSVQEEKIGVKLPRTDNIIAQSYKN